MQQPHQNFHGPNSIQDVSPQYVIQNDPPPEDGCCGGRSEKYNTAGGLGTGITHLVIGVLSIALSGATYAFATLIYSPYGVWSGVIFYIPAGIFGVLSKTKKTGVITAYLVMGIFSTLEAFVMLVMAAVWSGLYSLDFACYSFCGYAGYGSCADFCRSTESTAIHAVLAVLALIEFIVSIVGAAYCCGGLRCCCASPSPATTSIQFQNQQQQVAPPPQGYAQGPYYK